MFTQIMGNAFHFENDFGPNQGQKYAKTGSIWARKVNLAHLSAFSDHLRVFTASLFGSLLVEIELVTSECVSCMFESDQWGLAISSNWSDWGSYTPYKWY